jgi:uncharacterized oxidoreductase
MKRPTLCCLTLKVIVNSPINYFVAGIGDTLAKYYESEMIFENMQPEQFNTQLTISRAMAQACRDDLLENSEQAIADMKKGEVTPVFRKVVETVIVTSWPGWRLGRLLCTGNRCSFSS